MCGSPGAGQGTGVRRGCLFLVGVAGDMMSRRTSVGGWGLVMVVVVTLMWVKWWLMMVGGGDGSRDWVRHMHD